MSKDAMQQLEHSCGKTSFVKWNQIQQIYWNVPKWKRGCKSYCFSKSSWFWKKLYYFFEKKKFYKTYKTFLLQSDVRSAGKTKTKEERIKKHFQNIIGKRALKTLTDLERNLFVTKEKALLKLDYWLEIKQKKQKM